MSWNHEREKFNVIKPHEKQNMLTKETWNCSITLEGLFLEYVHEFKLNLYYVTFTEHPRWWGLLKVHILPQSNIRQQSKQAEEVK